MEITKMQLHIGKPDDGSRRPSELSPATFTRFVLPFAYKIDDTNIGEETPDLFYTVNPMENLSFTKRRKYLTRETSGMLYNTAYWLDMCPGWEETPWGKGEVIATLRSQKFLIGMLPPRIVLFEAKAEFDSEQKKRGPLLQTPSVLQTGFLLLDLYFPQQEKIPLLDDLLHLNESFRYFGMPYDSHAEHFKINFGEIPIHYSKNEIKTRIRDLNNLEAYFERWANLLETPIKQNGKVYRLFPEEWAENARNLSYNKGAANYNANWQIYDDNRTYVWTAAFLEQGGHTLQATFELEWAAAKARLEAKRFGHWHRLLNVDNPDFTSEKNTHRFMSRFESDWADQRTYKRWEDDGSWYGFSYHSGALIARKNQYPPFSSYYFDTSMLLFYIRLTLFRFSAELTSAIGQEHDQNYRFRKLRKTFSEFTVRYQFPLLSNQQQHLEMYELNRKYFDIDDFFKEIKQEIDNTHDFFESVEANQLSKTANQLATWGIPMAAAGLVTGIFGISSFRFVDCLQKNNAFDYNQMIEVTIVILVFLIVLKKFWSKGE